MFNVSFDVVYILFGRNKVMVFYVELVFYNVNVLNVGENMLCFMCLKILGG